MIGRLLLALLQLAVLMLAVALHLYLLAIVAGVFFLWRGSLLVYALLSHQQPATPSIWLTARLQAQGVSDGTWAVAVGVGAVVIVAGWLVAVVNAGRPGHYAGAAVAAFTAWILGMMRRARQSARPEQ